MATDVAHIEPSEIRARRMLARIGKALRRISNSSVSNPMRTELSLLADDIRKYLARPRDQAGLVIIDNEEGEN